MNMRRSDRAVTDPEKIDAIIRDCDCCRLAFATEGAPYIVPLNFGYVHEGEKRAFYFHGAREGRKLDLIRNAPTVGFELDTNHLLHPGDVGCSYSFRFQSVIGTGRVALVEDAAEKRRGLSLILQHYSGKANWDFPEKMLRAVAVWKLEVTELSCKEHE